LVANATHGEGAVLSGDDPATSVGEETGRTGTRSCVAPLLTPKPKPAAKPVNTKDRSRDRHSPGYMAEYMRRRRAAQKDEG